MTTLCFLYFLFLGSDAYSRFFLAMKSCYHCYHGLAIIDIILFQSKHSGSIFFYYVCLKLQFQESEALNFGHHGNETANHVMHA